jgi:hypothetical protein
VGAQASGDDGNISEISHIVDLRSEVREDGE